MKPTLYLRIHPDEYEALREAVEVLESANELEKERRSRWQVFANSLPVYREADAQHIDAAAEAVEVLEEVYAQRDEETEHWFQKWMGEYSDHHKTKAALRDAETKIAELHLVIDARTDSVNLANQMRAEWTEIAVKRQTKIIQLEEERDDYAARLKATNEDYRKLSIDAERIKTYKAALEEIARGYDVRNHKPGDGARRFAWHVLNSQINDGGSDF